MNPEMVTAVRDGLAERLPEFHVTSWSEHDAVVSEVAPKSIHTRSHIDTHFLSTPGVLDQVLDIHAGNLRRAMVNLIAGDPQ